MKKVLVLFLAVAGTAFAQTASIQVDANGTVLNFQSPSTKTINFPTGKLTVNGVQITGLETDASATSKGVTKLSVAPVSSSNPIAVGDNDSRNTDARTPTAHASTHASAGSDPVTLIISQITGLQPALDLKAPLASPAFTGVPLAPTAAVDTNTMQIATTGFVLAQAANATPIVASTGAVGTSTRYARQDHIHPAQTSVTGNAGTATALQTTRTINGTNFDGTTNITVAAAAGTLTGATLASGVTASSLLSASGGSFGTAAFTASSAYAAANQGVTTLSLATPNVLYTTPVTFSNSSGAWTGTLSLNAQSANTVFAGPTTGSAATPTMRALVLADLPSITSANLRSLLSDENGTGAALFDSATGPAFVTPKITTGINDVNSNSMLAFTATASAVDGFTFTNAATANPATVTIAATGSDSNINLALTPKGSGIVSSAAQFIGKAGSVSSPSFSFTGFANYGIYAGSGPNRLGFVVNGSEYAVVRGDTGCINVRGTFGYTWAPASDALATADTGLFRNAAAAVEVNNGTSGQWGGLKLGTRDGGTNTITNGLTLGHQSTGTPAAGLGEAILGNLDSSTTADQNAFRLAYSWSTATHASRTSKATIQLVNNAAALADVLTLNGDGSAQLASNLGIGTAPAANQFITMSGSAAALVTQMTNTLNTGTGAYKAVNDTGVTATFGIAGSTYATYGALVASDAFLYSSGSVTVMADNGSGVIKFAAGGNTEKMRIATGGVSFAGTNTNDSASVGNVGEYVSASVVQGSAVALTTATPKTVTSISLTAGDWDVTAVGALTGASTGTEFDVAIGTTTNSLTGTVLGNTRCQTPTVSLTGADASLMVPDVRVSISSTTTYYLIVQETFTVGSPAAYGRISARRRR